MALTVNTNISALRAGRQLGNAQSALSTSLERISSGKRINRAADDAAGLAVATNLKTEAMSIRQGMRNANDGISIIQVAEGAFNEAVDLFQRMRELAIQSMSETLHDDERAYVQDEYLELTKEAKRIGESTEFNGINLTDGTTTTISVQVGAQNDPSSRIDISLGGGMVGSGSLVAFVTSGFTSVASTATAGNALGWHDMALDQLNGWRSDLGATQNRLDSAISSGSVYAENLDAARSQIEDADYATETANMTKNQIMQQASLAALVQAKNLSQSVLSLI